MFTVWEPIMQHGFLLGGAINPLKKKREDIDNTCAPIIQTRLSLSISLDVKVTSCSCGTFACVAVSWWSLSFLCDRGKKETALPPPPPSMCCLLCKLVTHCHKHPVCLCGWLSDGAACSLCQVIHGNTSQPRVSPRFAPPLHHHHNYYFKKKRKKKKKNTSKQSWVLILGCREGWVKCVGRVRGRHLNGFLLSFNFENSLLPSQDSVTHVKTTPF